MNIRISFDTRVRTLFPRESSGATAARAAAIAALADDLAPKPPPTAGQTQAVVFVGPDLRRRIHDRYPDADLRETIEGLAYAYVCAHQTPEPSEKPSRYAAVAPTTLPLSHLQATMLAGIYGAFEARAVAMAEGSTGIGKTRVIAVAAAAAARSGERVVIAVPSVAVLAQLMSTWTDLGTGITAMPLLGRGQFIDPHTARWVIADGDLHPDTVAQASTWIDAGGPSHSPIGEVAWLRESLLQAAPEFPVGDCTHSTDTQDSPAEAVYQQLREGAAGAQVVVTTHAMVATHMRVVAYGNSDGLLGKIDTLLVDEAHQLESTIGDAFTDKLSVFRLRSRLRQLDPTKVRKVRAGAAVTRLLAVTEEAFDLLQSGFSDQRTTIVSAAPGNTATDRQREVIAALMARIHAETSALERVDPETARDVESLARRIETGSPAILVQFSPVRGYPSLSIGPASLQRPLQAFWETIGRAALLSATLYAPTQAGWSPHWIRSTLHIPADRCMPLQRLVEPWVYAPTVMLPDARAAAQLTPAAEENESESARHLDAVADVIRFCASTAAGGVLVLLTSYTAVRGLAARLASVDDLADRLVVQERGTPVSRYTRAFRDTPRPVWLATGPAWTGIDLADASRAPEDDLLLTDLVIGRLPFRMAEAPLQFHRAMSMGQNATRIEASFTFRQGIGRLMRRKGSMHRRIWLADGRIVDAGKNTHLVDPCRRIVSEYPSTGTFTIALERS